MGDELDIPCNNCGHSFKIHQQATFGLWYCDFEDRCECNSFERKRSPGMTNDERQAQVESDAYRWN